jgi:hypothetical protein
MALFIEKNALVNPPEIDLLQKMPPNILSGA